jgi:hypothetical protein
MMVFSKNKDFWKKIEAFCVKRLDEMRENTGENGIISSHFSR